MTDYAVSCRKTIESFLLENFCLHGGRFRLSLPPLCLKNYSDFEEMLLLSVLALQCLLRAATPNFAWVENNTWARNFNREGGGDDRRAPRLDAPRIIYMQI